MSRIKHVVLVLSGKGGVGKSSVAVQLALSLLDQQPGARIGLLDIDLTGPSLPRMLGLDGRDVHQSADGWVPVFLQNTETANGSLVCMSIGFLLRSSSESVVWRGPKKTAMVRQFLGDVRWGDLDWLIVDTPPGTSDEHISLLEQLQPLLLPTSDIALPRPTLSSVLVTTPQAVSLSDVSKELSFARRTALPVLGLVENLSGYACPHCGEVVAVFGRGGGEAFCEATKQEAKESGETPVRFLGRIPVDRQFLALTDSSAAKDATDAPATLLERYRGTPTFTIFKPICEQVIALTEGRELPEVEKLAVTTNGHH